MIWHYVVSKGVMGDFVVHSKHRTREAALKRLPVKQFQFNAAGISRSLYIVSEEGYLDLSLPGVLREAVLRSDPCPQDPALRDCT